MADRTQLYYEAQSRAFEKVKSIDGILVKQYNEEKDHFLDYKVIYKYVEEHKDRVPVTD